MNMSWANVNLKMALKLLNAIDPIFAQEGWATEKGNVRTFKVCGVTFAHYESTSKLMMD